MNMNIIDLWCLLHIYPILVCWLLFVWPINELNQTEVTSTDWIPIFLHPFLLNGGAPWKKLFELGDQSCNSLSSDLALAVLHAWQPLCSKSSIGSVQRLVTLAQRCPLKISWPCSQGEVPGNIRLLKQQDESSQILYFWKMRLISIHPGWLCSFPEWVHHQTLIRPELEQKLFITTVTI